MRTKLRSKVTLLFMSLGMLLAFAGVALADDVRDDLNGTANLTQTIATSGPGSQFENTYFIKSANNDPTNSFNGCNVSTSAPAFVKIVKVGDTSLPSGVSATYPDRADVAGTTETDMKFTDCANNENDTLLNAVQNVTFTGSTPGTYNLTASVTGPGTYDVSNANFTLVVKKATQISDVSGSATVGGTAHLEAKLKSAYQAEGALSGKPVEFKIGTTVVGTDSSTDSNGLAELNNVTLPAGFTAANTYNNAVTASFAGDTNYFQSSGTGPLTVNPACTTPAAPEFATKSSDATGDNGWFNASDGVPTILATSTSSSAAITYATEVNGGTKSAAYSSTVPTLGQGTTKVYAKATSGTCTPSETIDTFKVDTVDPSISDGGSWTQALPGDARTPDGNDPWYISEVFNKFTASDATSGLVGQTSPYTFTKGSDTDQGSAVKINSGDISDMAGNTNSLDSAAYNIDLDAPTGVAGSPDRDPDSNGWYNAPVGFTFTGTDTVSDIASCSTLTYGDDSTETDGTGKTVDGSCTDNAGNQSASVASSAIDYDATPPVIANVGADSTFSTPNAAGWYKTNVRHNFTATDNLSGFGTSGALTLNFYKDISQEGSAVTTSSGTQTDQAGNVATALTSSPAYKIDKTAPSVIVTGVSNDGSYTYGNVPTPGCDTNDQPGLSGVKNNATVNVTGGTGGFGTLTATCSGAVDNADNAKADVSVQYTVSGTFFGWLQPVDGDGGNTIVNVGKAGRTYPIKWQIKDSSDALISDTTAQLLVGTMTGGQAKVPCGSIVGAQDVLEDYTTGSTVLRYDAISDQFIYNYKAPSTTGCYTFAIKNADGAHVKQANFNFTK